MAKKLTVFLISIVVSLALGTLAFASSPPSITALPASPSTVTAGTPTSVTFITTLKNSGLIRQSVLLLQVDDNDNVIKTVGPMSAESNGTYTLTVPIDSSTPVLLRYRVSAAFLGFLKRSLSPQLTVAVAPLSVTLPPDPGPAGMETIGGTDSDSDAVRDDVQRWIAVTYYNSAKLRSGATQLAKALQSELTGSMDRQTQISHARLVDRAEECSLYIDTLVYNDLLANGQDTYSRVLSQQLNTSDRTRLYSEIDQQMSGQFIGIPPAGQYWIMCDVDPRELPN